MPPDCWHIFNTCKVCIKKATSKVPKIDENCHLKGTKKAEKDPKKGSPTANGPSQPRQQGLCINTQPWLKDFDGRVKGDEDRRVSVGDPVRHLAREDVSRAGGFALGGRGERMEVDASELLLQFLIFLLWQVELSVAHCWWLFYQERRSAANFLIEKAKELVLDAVVVGVTLVVFSAVKEWVAGDMMRSGELCFERFVNQRLESHLNWVSFHGKSVRVNSWRVFRVDKINHKLFWHAAQVVDVAWIEEYFQGV